MKYFVVGLGNPGSEYERTRHNIGRRLVFLLAKTLDASVFKVDVPKKCMRTEGELKGAKLQLIAPDTFMNKSGTTVAAFVSNVKVAERLMVIYDDLDLPWGSMRISFNRGSGGHKGVESIIRSIKTREFIRLRIGVCPTTPTGKLKKPQGEEAIVAFLLGNFDKKEEAAMKVLSERVESAIEKIVTEGYVSAMNDVNRGV